MHDGPNFSAERTLIHVASGAGARQRRSPTGAAAYGMPRYARTLGREPCVPRTGPVDVWIGVVNLTTDPVPDAEPLPPEPLAQPSAT